MSRVSPAVPWATMDDLPESCDTTAISPDTYTAAFIFASDVLYNLTRRRWPTPTQDTFLPFVDCRCYIASCYNANGYIDNVFTGGSGYRGPTSQPEMSQAQAIYHGAVKLPAIDVVSIDEVRIDGAVIAPSQYRLRGRYLMAARDAQGLIRSWPCWNDLYANSNADPNTFQVKYTAGANPPPSMVRACALLAQEFAIAWTPDCGASCRLPQRVTTMTRAGMTFAVIDPMTMFKDGMVGVPDIDMLIQSVNRGESQQRAFVGRPGQAFRVSRP